MLSLIWKEEKPIVTEASAEHTLPLIPPEGSHVSLERVVLHLLEHACDSLLNGFGQVLQIPLCVIRELTDPAHA